MIQYLVTNERVGATRTLVADYSARAQSLVFASNNRGFAECTAFVPMGLSEAFSLYDALGALRITVSDTSSGTLYDGRLEDIAITGDGVTLTALGFARALSDAPYTAMWSTTSVGSFRPVLDTESAGHSPEQYTFDTNNRILIALPQGQIYGNVANYGGMVYQAPSGGSRQIIGVSFDAVVTLPLNWIFDMIGWQSGFAAPTVTAILTGNAGVQSINKFYTFAGCDYLEFRVYNNTGGNYTVNNAPNVWSVRITNPRLVTTTANKVDTTTTAGVLAGSGVSVPVVSSARMYVGQRLHMGIPASLGFNATVLTIPDATHFTADLSAAMAGGGNVQAFVVYADEIVDDLITTTNALNSNQLSSSLALTDSPAMDLTDQTYFDQRPADVLDYLAKLGDSAGNVWEWGVKTDQRLYFRRQGSVNRTWYIDISDLDIRRLLDQLTNSIYAVYQDASGRSVRAAATSNAASIARYGLTRRSALSVSSTSATQAALQQATALADGATPQPQSGITVDRIFDANGARWPLWYVQAGDTIVIRNLAPTLSSSIDRIRVFRLARAEYAFGDDTLNLEPETPLPMLDALLAQVTPPSWITAPWWVQVGQK